MSKTQRTPMQGRTSHPAGVGKNGKNRLSPAALQLDSNMVSAVEVRNGKEADEHFSPGTSFTTKVEDDDEARVLMKIKTKASSIKR